MNNMEDKTIKTNSYQQNQLAQIREEARMAMTFGQNKGVYYDNGENII